MLVFLMLNVYELIYIQEELVDIILELAAGKKNVDDILQWIILHQKE